MADRFPELSEGDSNMEINLVIKQLLNSIIAKDRDLSMSRRPIIRNNTTTTGTSPNRAKHDCARAL